MLNWVCLGMLWSDVEWSGVEHLEWSAWGCLGVGSVWECLVALWSAGECLGMLGSAWECLGTLGSAGECWGVLGNAWGC